MSKYKIRVRNRSVASPPAGQRPEWTEYQVLCGRVVIARFDLLSQAEAFIAEHNAA